MVKDHCRCCNKSNLIEYLDLGDQPLANSYHKGEILPTFPLRVNRCKDCWHSQLSCVVDPTLMFKHYLYVSSTTQTFRNHCQELAEDAVKRVKNHKVLDVACNDGLLLEKFRNLNCDVFGVDPAENLREITKTKNIDVEVAYWGQETQLNRKFDIITGTNVFAHVDDVDGFLTACHRHLEEDGVVILEFPYCKKMIEETEFDTIYHEHLSYFLVTPFLVLMDRLKLFHVDDVILTPIHGGSIRFFLRIGNYQHCDKATKLATEESDLLQECHFLAFNERIRRQKFELANLLKNKRVVGYGASAKGNTLLNSFGIDLEYIVDDNPLKWGYLTPGRNIPICSPERLKQEQDVYVLLLAWNFAEEIKKKVGRKGIQFIRYVPEVCMEGATLLG